MATNEEKLVSASQEKVSISIVYILKKMKTVFPISQSTVFRACDKYRSIAYIYKYTIVFNI